MSNQSTASPTSVALAYEQASMWNEAQMMYENCQLQGKRQYLHFPETDYLLWEDHWIHMAQKLQNWEILTELAQLEGNQDLLLECYWRLKPDWAPEKDQIAAALQAADTPVTPRRKVMEAYLQLVKSQDSGTPFDRQTFLKTIEEGTQLTLRKWWSLPEIVSDSHIPLLQMFQSFVELNEAAQVYMSLANTDKNNLDNRAVELRNVLSTWRERLPNDWDDINIWSDLIAWRQHVFAAINRTYIPLAPSDNRSSVNPGGSNSASHAYRDPANKAEIIKESLVAVTGPSFEEQTTALRLKLADYYENNEEWTEAAKVLQAIPLESGHRTFSDVERLDIYIRIVRLLLEDDDTVSAEGFHNRAALLINSTDNKETHLKYKLNHAKILDSRRKFVEAGLRYHEISFVGELAESDRDLAFGTQLRRALPCRASTLASSCSAVSR
ncbi:hypothetical protein BT69DRAFT_1333491 [Atractiella rhizophila]|nr:hypothetical protein BT69DRAFT_1333491 [Atractiella rhizophila]